MRTFINAFMAIAFLTLIATSCKKDEKIETLTPLTTNSTDNFLEDELMVILQNGPAELINIPPATIPLIDYPAVANVAAGSRTTCTEVLSPASLTATLQPGNSVSEALTACLDGAPPKGDVLFCFDLTGSMGSVLTTVKHNSINIMNAVSTSIPDSYFGLITHKDYPGSFNSCGYSSGYGTSTDFPYARNQSLVGTPATVQAAINPLTVGGGADLPESFARALYEAANDPGIGWRSGSARIVVAFLDAIPHDCNLNTGWDPGRDGVVGTADDIDMDAVIAQFVAENIKLIVVSRLSSVLPVWNNYAVQTGGQAVLLGTGDIATTVSGLINASVSTIGALTLEVDQPAYAGWLTSVVPNVYNNVDLDEPLSLPYNITLTVPPGTADGNYSFDVDLVGDGAVYGSHLVNITVLTDSDGDGCLDDVDPHPNSNTAPTVVIDGCNSGVTNIFVSADGCSTMSDLIADCAANANNHGQFVSCVSALTNAWKAAGIISGAQKGAIMSCAAGANIP